MFIYKTETVCKGYSIRKVNWLQIFKENITLADEFTERVSREFHANISSKVMKEKKRDLQKWSDRADYEGILSITETNKTNTNKEAHSDENNNTQAAIDEEEKALIDQMQQDDIPLQMGKYMQKLDAYKNRQTEILEIFEKFKLQHYEVVKENFMLR